MKKKPRRKDEALISRWTYVRYYNYERFAVVGMYVGIATVGIFIYWYCFYDWAEE